MKYVKKTGYDGVCNKSCITEPLFNIYFLSWGNMTETEDIIDECDEELHQNFTVNTPGTIIGQKFETFKIGKTSNNVPNARTN